MPVGANLLLRRAFSDKCTLLREWAGSNTPIFFDLGEAELLWWLLGTSTNGLAYLTPYSRAKFIETDRGGAAGVAREFDEFVNEFAKLLSNHESQLRAQSLQHAASRPLRRTSRF